MAYTQKQLVGQIKQLKAIKPNQEWADLTLSQIMGQADMPAVQQGASLAGFSRAAWQQFVGHKAAYSFAMVSLVLMGVIGFAQYTVPGDTLFPVKKLAEQSQANLLGSSAVAQNIATLNSRVQDLAQVTKSGKSDKVSSVVGEIKTNATELAAAVKNKQVDLAETKEIVQTLKVLADVKGTDVSADPGVQDLYQALVEAQLADLDQATLTEEQSEQLEQAKQLADEGSYSEALEVILLITNNQ